MPEQSSVTSALDSVVEELEITTSQLIRSNVENFEALRPILDRRSAAVLNLNRMVRDAEVTISEAHGDRIRAAYLMGIEFNRKMLITRAKMRESLARTVENIYVARSLAPSSSRSAQQVNCKG